MTQQNSGVFFGAPDFERGKYNWAKIVQEETGEVELYKRVSTVAGYLDDKSGLIDWNAAKVARGVVRNKALTNIFLTLDWEEDKSKISEALSKAKEIGGATDSADQGTAFHKVVEDYHRGKRIDYDVIPPEFARTLDAYKAFLEKYGIEVAGTEVRVVNDEHKVAGSTDLVYLFTKDVETPWGIVRAGTIIIGDIKTGSVGPYAGLKMGLQLAFYAKGQPYNVMKGVREDWPHPMNSSIGLIVKIDIEQGSVLDWWLDLDTAYEFAEDAVRINDVRYRGKKLITDGSAKVITDAKPAAKPEPKAEPTPKEAPAEPEPTPEPEPEAPPTKGTPWEQEADTEDDPMAAEIKADAAKIANVGQAKEKYREWRRKGASTDQLIPIALRAQELGATMKGKK